MIDCITDFSAATGNLSKRLETREWMEGHGLDVEALFYQGRALIGVDTINLRRDGIYDLATDGKPAIIIPVGSFDPNSSIIWDSIYDLVAVIPSQPQHWWQRTGNAVVLGECWADYQQSIGEPVHLVETPLDWLRANGQAICILDWGAPLPPCVTDCSEVVAATKAVAAQLQSILTPKVPVKV